MTEFSQREIREIGDRLVATGALAIDKSYGDFYEFHVNDLSFLVETVIGLATEFASQQAPQRSGCYTMDFSKRTS